MPTGQDILNQLNQSPYKEAPPTTQPLQPANMNALLQALGQGLMKPVDAAQNIMNQGDRLPSQMTIDPGKEALMAGPGALMSTFGRSPAGSLGITGSNLVLRRDAAKLIQEMRAKNSSYDEIANALNTRFAPILDKGREVSEKIVGNAFKKMQVPQDTASKELLSTLPSANKGSYGYTPSLEQARDLKNQLRNSINTWETALKNTPIDQRSHIQDRINQMMYRLDELNKSK